MGSSVPDRNGFGSDFKAIQSNLPSSIERSSDYLHSKLFPRKMSKETWCVPNPDFLETLKEVESVIAGSWGKALAMPLDDTAARYAKIAQTIKTAAPRLRLIWWRTLEKLGETPISHKGYSVTLEEAAAICQAAGKIFAYYFLSHRWESREHPDPTGHKSRICAKYGAERTRTFNEEVFFWIDYTCIDQDGVPPFIAALPLYCSGAQVIMVPYHEEYEERGWCLVERLAYAALNCPLQFVCGMKYVEYAKKKGWNQYQSCFTFFNDSSGKHYSWLRTLANPGLGKLGYECDRPLIKNLTELLLRQWGKCWVRGSKWPPPGSLDRCSTTGQYNPVSWGKTTVNVILISMI